MLLLIVVSLATAGIGGLAYWLLCRRYQHCPRCGLSWTHAWPDPRDRRPPPREGAPFRLDLPEPKLPRTGSVQRGIAFVFLVGALLLSGLGIVAGNPVLIPIAISAAVVGGSLYMHGVRALERRREAVLHLIQRRILLLARDRGGRLTVSEVAESLDLSLAVAERSLTVLEDGYRVRSEITDEGVIVYEFLEARELELDAIPWLPEEG